MEAVTAALHNQYEKAKENLKGVDENIIKLYGRDPNEKRQRRVSRPGGNVGGAMAGRLFGEARRIINNPNREPVGGPLGLERGFGGPARRVSLDGPRLGGIQSRLGPKRRRNDSGDEDEPSSHKPMIQSAVVVPTIEAPKREDSVAMKTDKKGMARNRRMFGALLGTLQSFQKDSKKEEDREKRRAEVEKKLEEKQKDEEHQLRRDRAALWNQRRENQRELRQLEVKMKLVKSFEEWEQIVRDQAYFIKTTKGKHHIYYKPRIMLPANERALEDTEDYIEALVKSRRKKLEEEIERVMSAPVRHQRKTPDPDAQGKDVNDKSGHSDSESELSESEAEGGEVQPRKQPKAADLQEPEANLPVKTEREEGMEVKQEMVDGGKVGVEDGEEPVQVSNMVEDEVESEEEAPSSRIESRQQQSEEKPAGKSDQKPAKEKKEEKKKSVRRSRSSSSSGRSPSRSRSRPRNGRPPPPRRRPHKPTEQGKAKAKAASGSGSSSSGSNSGSGSESGSGSASGSDSSGSGSESEPEVKGK